MIHHFATVINRMREALNDRRKHMHDEQNSNDARSQKCQQNPLESLLPFKPDELAFKIRRLPLGITLTLDFFNLHLLV